MSKYENLRPCTIDGTKSARFHEWFHWAEDDFAMIEYEDGTVDAVQRNLVRFTDHTEPEVVISNPRPQEPKKEADPQKQEEPEVTYKIGDKFKHENGWTFQLVAFPHEFLTEDTPDNGAICLILNDGRCYSNRIVIVKDCKRITQIEFSKICNANSGNFTLIKEDSKNGQN